MFFWFCKDCKSFLFWFYVLIDFGEIMLNKNRDYDVENVDNLK